MARLLSIRASAVQLISDDSIDKLCRYPVLLMSDKFAHSGQRCFVDVFGFMHLCVLLPNADGGGIRTCRFSFYFVAESWGFQMARIWMMDLCS